jgi:glutathione S-transferase
MIELHQYPAVWGLPSLSPFCIKVEMHLRQHQIPYRTVTETNPARGPKGKMPFIMDGHETVADSTFILLHLERTRGIKAKGELLAHAQALAFQRMVEENLYFVLLYSRWIDPVGWNVVKKEFQGLFPPLLGAPFLRLVRRQLRRQAQAQGIGKHSATEVYEIGNRDLQAIATFLGSKEYVLGESYSALDATIYSFLLTILKQPIESSLKAAVLSHKNLVDYCRREERKCFPEFVDKYSLKDHL